MGILINGVDAKATYGWAARLPAGWADAPVRVTQTAQLLNRQGARALTLPQEQPRKITLPGWIVGTSVADRLAKLDALKNALSASGGVQLVFPDNPARYITATLDTITVGAGNGAAFIERTLPCDIGMTALDPYFYDTSLTTLNVASLTEVPLGTAPVRPVFTMSGPNANLLAFTVLDHAGVVNYQQIIFTGALSGGDTIVVDNGAMTVTKNGVNALALITSGDFVKIDPALHANFATSTWPTIVAPGNAPFTMTYRRAWR